MTKHVRFDPYPKVIEDAPIPSNTKAVKHDHLALPSANSERITALQPDDDDSSCFDSGDEASATFINNCWACKYSEPRKRKHCLVCKGEESIPQTEKYLSAYNPASEPYQDRLPYLKANDLYWKWQAYHNPKDFYAYIDRKRPFVKVVQPLEDSTKRKPIRLLRENEAKKTPGIIVFPAADCDPTIELQTWLEFGRQRWDRVVNVCIRKKVELKKKHLKDCKCKTCHHAAYMDWYAKVRIVPETVGLEWPERWRPWLNDKIFREKWRGFCSHRNAARALMQLADEAALFDQREDVEVNRKEQSAADTQADKSRRKLLPCPDERSVSDKKTSNYDDDELERHFREGIALSHERV